ncbi:MULTISPECIES: hypothetical protein [unclassified Bartonella]|uniref:hypothetical protein n=1 Tax=unclassified Bartonella TaxID=2645622 RepID=UPI00300DE743
MGIWDGGKIGDGQKLKMEKYCSPIITGNREKIREISIGKSDLKAEKNITTKITML